MSALVQVQDGSINQSSNSRLGGTRVALVHHWFVSFAGGERVVDTIASMFPSADIFTLFLDEEKLSPALRGRKITSSFLDRIPGARRVHRHCLPLYPLAVEMLDLSGYDLLITSDSGPRIRVEDPGCVQCLNVATDPSVGTTPWHELKLNFVTGPQTDIVRVSVWRPVSRTYPMDIGGEFWLSSISLTSGTSAIVSAAALVLRDVAPRADDVDEVDNEDEVDCGASIASADWTSTRGSPERTLSALGSAGGRPGRSESSTSSPHTCSNGTVPTSSSMSTPR